MPNNVETNSQIWEYEQLLNQYFTDAPDDWDMYENMGEIHTAFREGKTAQEVFEQNHGWLFGRTVYVDSEYYRDWGPR